MAAMPRTARASGGGVCCHVVNRGNGQAEVFHKSEDYAAFLRPMGEGVARLPIAFSWKHDAQSRPASRAWNAPLTRVLEIVPHLIACRRTDHERHVELALELMESGIAPIPMMNFEYAFK